MMNVRALTIGTITVGLFAWPASSAGSREKYESPDYKVVKKDGAFEVREYPAMVVASAPMPKSGANRNSPFMNLFRYISGQNEARQKIAMTSPVITTMEGDNRVMSFFVPENVAREGAPKADNGAIRITKRPGGRFAVYRYSGRWTEARETAARNKLMAWIKEQGIEVVGAVEKANYDPPFTLPMLRRNEVLVRIR